MQGRGHSFNPAVEQTVLTTSASTQPPFTSMLAPYAHVHACLLELWATHAEEGGTPVCHPHTPTQHTLHMCVPMLAKATNRT